MELRKFHYSLFVSGDVSVVSDMDVCTWPPSESSICKLELSNRRLPRCDIVDYRAHPLIDLLPALGLMAADEVCMLPNGLLLQQSSFRSDLLSEPHTGPVGSGTAGDVYKYANDLSLFVQVMPLNVFKQQAPVQVLEAIAGGTAALRCGGFSHLWSRQRSWSGGHC